MTHLEISLERDIARLTRKVRTMAGLAETALRRSMQALAEKNRQTAYSVILRDQRIDELEKEIDRLCLEFFVRQQPVAKTLRFAYAVMKINAELERVGDYAESIARQILHLCSLDVQVPFQRFAEIADRAIPMLSAAVEAFMAEDPELARKAMQGEDAVDLMRHQLSADLVKLQQQGGLPVQALSPLLNIVNRLERVGDQAKNICQQVLYLCTGEYLKHPGSDVFRVLFVDETNSTCSQMAEAAGNALDHPKFVFWSAGLERRPIDPSAIAFLASQGVDVSGRNSKSVEQIPHLDHFQIIVALAPAARAVFPPAPTKAVCLDWSVADPAAITGSSEERQAAYACTYQFLQDQVKDLVQAVMDDQNDEGEQNR